MTLSLRLEAGARLLLAAVVVLAPLLFSRDLVDIFQLPKWTAIVLGAVLIGIAWLLADLLAGRLIFPASAATVAIAVFMVAVVVATASSEAPVQSLFGAYRRGSGALLYVAGGVLALATVRFHDRRSVRVVVLALLWAVVVLAAYALLQRLGFDPIPWERRYGRDAHAALGNPNFASGFLGLGVPLVAWWAWSQASGPRRVAGAGLLGATGLALLATGSNQGIVAAAAGLAVLALGWLLGAADPLRRVGLALWGLGAAAAGSLVVAGLAGAGPLSALGQARSFALRIYYWQAAAAMARDRPILGVGMDMYGLHYRRYRPVEAALSSQLQAANDAVHSVPLAMLSSGGLVLGLAYLAVVLTVGWALVNGLRRADGPQRMLLAGVGGAWAGYHTQSLVSIDVPALALAHWVLAGVILVLATAPGEPLREWVYVLPWARAKRRRRAVPGQGWIVTAGAAGALAALVLGTLPLRADAFAKEGIRAAQRGDLGAAAEQLHRAQELAPWQGAYWFEEAKVYVDAGRIDLALHAFAAAAERGGGELGAPLSAARAARHLEQHEVAAGWYREALRLEPIHPRLKVEGADFAYEVGEPRTARRLLAEALEVDPDNRRARRLLRQVRGDR